MKKPPDDRPTIPAPAGERVGADIGEYHLFRVLGEGGFGTMYLAQRQSPFVQRVALKIIKPGMDSRAVVARFEQEWRALASLDHPHIARIFDAGRTPEGRPYFALEYVPGPSITAFADEHRLTMEQRVRLFIPVCEAAHHAHLRGLIHRDIKPSNILVSRPRGPRAGIPEGHRFRRGAGALGFHRRLDRRRRRDRHARGEKSPSATDSTSCLRSSMSKPTSSSKSNGTEPRRPSSGAPPSRTIQVSQV